MSYLLIFGAGAFSLFVSVSCCLGWQLLRQNGRVLLRLDEMETRLDELEFGEPAEPKGSANGQAADQMDARPQPQGEGEAQDRANRFGSRSLARSRVKRDGLKAGTSAPSFRLPFLDGGELSLEELRGKRVLLVFSDPHCGPCQALAPQLEKFHQEQADRDRSPVAAHSHRNDAGALHGLREVEAAAVGDRPGSGTIAVVMIGRGDPKENRTKVKEHGLTFPVVLQQRWEISRLYAMFATPIAYLIDEAGIIAADVAVGVESIRNLATNAIPLNGEPVKPPNQELHTRI